MKFANTVRKFPCGLLIDLAAALGASIGASSFTSFIRFQNQLYFDLPTYAWFLFLAVVAYMTTALLLHWIWPAPFRRIIPSWILIAFIGSALFTCIRLLPGIIKGWNDPYRTESSLLLYLLTEFNAAKSVILVLSLLTLPITGTINYLIRWIQHRSATDM